MIIIFQSPTEIFDLDESGDLKKIVYSDSSLFNYQYFPELSIVDPDFCSLQILSGNWSRLCDTDFNMIRFMLYSDVYFAMQLL